MLFTFSIAFHPSPPRSSEAIFVGSSLKSVTWLPLHWIRRRPPCDMWNCSFHPDGDSHSFHLDGNSVRPTFHLLRIFHIRNSVRTTFHLLWIFHSRRLSPNGRGGRFNFPGQTCPDPLVALTRRTSAADNSDSLDSLARQTLAIRRIHFRPQSKSKPRQY